jgi:hypothetical protein
MVSGKSWFAKHFIPHEGNDHRPHVLRGDSTRAILAIVIFLEVFSFLVPTLSRLNMTGGMAAVLPTVLADLTNEERKVENLSMLTVSPVLNMAAEMKARDMAAKGYFAHTSPEGKTPWYWLEQAGYTYQYAGENLAINFLDSKDVTAAWLASPAHRANIVKQNYTEIGTGIATGAYEGRETVFVAQVYANPMPEIVKKAPEPKAALSQPVKKGKAATAAAPEPKNVLGAETGATSAAVERIATSPSQNSAPSAQEKPTFAQKLLASPRSTTNALLAAIFTVVFAALVLYVFIKARNHHFDLITNGLAVLAIIGAIFVGNYYFTHRTMMVTESLDYANQVSG